MDKMLDLAVRLYGLNDCVFTQNAGHEGWRNRIVVVSSHIGARSTRGIIAVFKAQRNAAHERDMPAKRGFSAILTSPKTLRYVDK